jgi:tetratricopeptide (TPR) repeat protein
VPFPLLILLGLSFCSSTPALAQNLASAQAEVKRLFEDDLLCDRLSTDKIVAALPTAQFVAANATDAEGQALGLRALAEIAMEKRDFAGAEAGFRQVLSLYPASTQGVWAHYGLGELCRKLANCQGRPELRVSAVAEFQAVLAAKPAHAIAGRALEKSGLAYVDMGEYQKAIEVYNQAIASYPGTPGAVYAHGGLAVLYRELHRWDDGIKYARLRASFAGYQRASEFQLQVGIMLGEKGDLAAAAGELQKVLDLWPNEASECVRALYQKGFCLKALGDVSGAAAAWRRVVAEFPSYHLSVRAREQLELLGGS